MDFTNNTQRMWGVKLYNDPTVTSSWLTAWIISEQCVWSQPQLLENPGWDHVHGSTLTTPRCSERAFLGAKWEEPRLRSQTPGFKSWVHDILALWALASYSSPFVGGYAYRGVFGIWRTQLMVTIITMQKQGITIIIIMILFIIFSLSMSHVASLQPS